MLSAENLASIESEGRRLGLAARQDPTRDVPQYEDWSLADLASHTASILARTTEICRTLPQERVSAPRIPDGADPLDWYDESLDEMLIALHDADPEAPCWTIGDHGTQGFWEHRMTVEVGVHRWDAHHALGTADRLTDRTAINGLDEFGGMWLPMLAPLTPIEVAPSDMNRRWRFGGEKPETTVTDSVSEVYLRLMSRPSSATLPEDWVVAVDGLPAVPKR